MRLEKRKTATAFLAFAMVEVEKLIVDIQLSKGPLLGAFHLNNVVRGKIWMTKRVITTSGGKGNRVVITSEAAEN